MAILITGSSGMIGTALCEALLKKNIDFIGIDRLPNRWHESINSKTIIADLEQDNWQKNLPSTKISCIVHLAAKARVKTSIHNNREYLENVTILFNVLEFATQRGIKKIVFSSSKEVYGNTFSKSSTEGKLDLSGCLNPYSASKLSGESLLHSYSNCQLLNHVIVRFSNVYGKYDTSDRVIPKFINKGIKGEKLVVYGQDKKLDFIYLDDVVTAIQLAIENFDAVKNQTFNIAYGRGIRLEYLAKKIQSQLKINKKIGVTQNRLGEILEYRANTKKAEKQLGFKAKTSITQGLKELIKWQKEVSNI